MFKRCSGLHIPIILLDGDNKPITTGDVRTYISRDAKPWQQTRGNAVPVTEELWRLWLTVNETDCDVYVVRVTHKNLPRPLYYTDRSFPKSEPTPVHLLWNLSVNSADTAR